MNPEAARASKLADAIDVNEHPWRMYYYYFGGGGKSPINVK
jgi:hypothetical protein